MIYLLLIVTFLCHLDYPDTPTHTLYMLNHLVLKTLPKIPLFSPSYQRGN